MEKKSHVKPLKRFHTSKLSPIRHAGFALLILRILESSLVDSRGARVRLGETEYQVKNSGDATLYTRFHTSKLSPIRHAGFALLILRILESSLVDSRGARVRFGETEYQVKNGLRPVNIQTIRERSCSQPPVLA